MRVTLFDYGAGNLHSLAKALETGRDELRIETDPRRAIDTDVLVLPGVGAFASAAERLAPGRAEMRAALERGLPCIGICLGMQLLFDRSDEGGGAGLGVVAGDVTRLSSKRVPHMGWNTLDDPREPLFGRASLREVYYAHSFACRPRELSVVTAWTEHEGDRFAASVRLHRTVGVQFHPEKSSTHGLAFLHAFLEEQRR